MKKRHVLGILFLTTALVWQFRDSIQTNNHENGDRYSSEIFLGELIVAHNDSGLHLWRISPREKITLNREKASRLNRALNSLRKGPLDAPFAGYKKYMVIPDRKIIVGIYDDGHGLNVWKFSRDEYGYLQIGEAILSGDIQQANLMEEIVIGK